MRASAPFSQLAFIAGSRHPRAARQAEVYPRVIPTRHHLERKPGLEVNVNASIKVLSQQFETGSYIVNNINYWAVRILAPEWFERNVPHIKLRPLPTIREDRIVIRNHLARRVSIPTSAADVWHKYIKGSAAGQRASIRDRDWLEQQRPKVTSPNSDQSTQRWKHDESNRDLCFEKREIGPTLSQAKATLVHYCKTKPSRRRLEYWTLRIKDPLWLIKKYPNIRLHRIPSIRQDRESIRQLLSVRTTVDGKEVDGWADARKSAPAFRARVRDAAWLREAKRRYMRLRRRTSSATAASKRATNNRAPTADRDRNLAIKNALEACVTQTGFPIRPTVPVIAERAGLSYHVTRYLMRCDSNLQSAVLKARMEVPHRRLEWAIAKIRAEHRPLTVNTLVRLAKVEDRFLVRDAIDRSETPNLRSKNRDKIP